MQGYNIDYFFKEDMLFQLSKQSNKAVMYIRADGPNSVNDSERLEEIWDFYYGKCDIQIINALKQNGEVYCYFMTETQANNAFHEWFPQKNQLLDEEMEFYIYVNLVNVSTGVDVVNG